MSSPHTVDELAIKLHKMNVSDCTLDPSPKLARRWAWSEIKATLSVLKELEGKREECSNLVASQGQILAAFAHSLVRAVVSGNAYATRLAYADLARYAKITMEGEQKPLVTKAEEE